MTETTDLLLTKSERRDSGRIAISSSFLPPIVVDQAVNRLQGLCLAFAIGTSGFWLGSHLIAGTLSGELSRPGDSVPPSVAILSSVLLYFVIRGSYLPKPTLAKLGLVYQVVVSFALAFSQYWGTFGGVLAEDLSFDRVGVSLVGVWMITATVLVPNRPGGVLVSLLLSSAAPGIAFFLSSLVVGGPHLSVGPFLYILVLPYLICMLAAYLAAQTLYRLGRELHRATEMGAYKLESLIGRGGMGEVWKARHRMLVRPAAIKLIRPEAVAEGDTERARSILRRFEREAQATATLTSHHTIELYDFGVSDAGTFYYVMELLEGVDLETLIRRHGPVAPERAVYLLLQACHSLADAHHRGLVHRDIKPANIFVCHRGLEYDFVKVLDFGLVAASADEPADMRLTVEGSVIATPAYLAPEMAAGGTSDARSDVYSLGCVAYWLLTGELVFEAETTIQMILAHSNTAPRSPSAVSEITIPLGLDRLVLDCLQKQPEKRPQSMLEMAERLRDCGLSSDWDGERAARWWAQRAAIPSGHSD